jgi:hypothetical protein
MKRNILTLPFVARVLISGHVCGIAAEVPFLPSENAYNPIPSPDGRKIAFVRTGWGRTSGADGLVISGGLGRSSLRSEVVCADADGKLLTDKPLGNAFLAGWTQDGGQLICFRDWRFFTVSLTGQRSPVGTIPDLESRPERVHYLSQPQRFIWIERDYGRAIIRMSNGEVLAARENWGMVFVVPSPDERWIAAVGGQKRHLLLFDRRSNQWTDLGPITMHPDREWDYLKTSWDPWFRDSSALTFVSDNSIVVVSPDGTRRKEVCKLELPAGLATASPSGKAVAYVTFQPTPMKLRPDLEFWGNAQIWVVPVTGSETPKAVSLEHDDQIYSLKWLTENSLIFDRFSNEPLYSRHPRLWKATLPVDREKSDD